MSERPNINEIKEGVKQYLHRKYKIAIPPKGASVEEVYGAKHDDYWSADTVSVVLPSVLSAHIPKDANKAFEDEIHKFADVAFNVARVAKRKNAVSYEEVVANYISSVMEATATSTEQPNLISNATFEAKTFACDDGTKINGRDILREAVKGQTGQVNR